MRDPIGRYASSLDAPGDLYRPPLFSEEVQEAVFDEYARDMDAWVADRVRLKIEEEAAHARIDKALERITVERVLSIADETFLAERAEDDHAR